MDLGKDFLRCAARVLVCGLKKVPAVGTIIEMVDDCCDELRELEQEQKQHSLEDRVKQLEEAAALSVEQAREIARQMVDELRKEGKEISLDKEEAVLDIMAVMPANIIQKTKVTLSQARTRGTAGSTALPLGDSSSIDQERRQFYAGLLPRRRPRFKEGEIAPYRPDWVFESFLGMGGFGEVWCVKHTLLEECQALKLCLEEKSGEILKREAQTIAMVRKNFASHPNIVAVRDTNLREHPYWIAFEYVQGGTLDSYIRSFGGPKPLDEAMRVFSGICHGMADAYNIGLVHRDLKPANVLIEDDTPKIADFGLGKIVAEREAATSSRHNPTFTLRGYGTAGYMSPEQQELKEAHSSDDVYALAVMLFQMLVGLPGKSAECLEDDLADLMPKIPQEIVDLLTNCVRRRRGNRPDNAGVLLKKVLQYVPGTQSVSAVGQTKRPVETQPPESLVIERATLQVASGIQIPKDFSFLRENTYKCGGISNTVAEYKHVPTGMEFVLIPGGTFDMGSDSGYYDNEKPVHKVTLSPYLIGKYQVTQEVWKKMMQNNPSNFKGNKDSAKRPVETVSWNDCKTFCKKTGLQLPTEAQWEFACRAGSKGRYCFGDDESQLEEYAWYSENSGFETHPVGEKKENAFGLFDVHGNVWEWCEDWYGTYPISGVATNPTGPTEGSRRVIRGGSCCRDADCRASCRGGDGPGSLGVNLGLRGVRSLS